MSAPVRLAPTRTNLLRARRRLARVERGAAILRRKREALAAALFALARPAADARVRVLERSRRAYAALLRALAVHGETGLRALSWPGREVRVGLRPTQVWGVPVAEIAVMPRLRRSLGARGTTPGSAGPAAAEAAADFERLVEELLEQAPRELTLRRMAQALSRTSRQIHMLEQRVAPPLREQIAAVQRALEEREREEQRRLRRLVSKRGRRR